MNLSIILKLDKLIIFLRKFKFVFSVSFSSQKFPLDSILPKVFEDFQFFFSKHQWIWHTRFNCVVSRILVWNSEDFVIFSNFLESSIFEKMMKNYSNSSLISFFLICIFHLQNWQTCCSKIFLALRNSFDSSHPKKTLLAPIFLQTAFFMFFFSISFNFHKSFFNFEAILWKFTFVVVSVVIFLTLYFVCNYFFANLDLERVDMDCEKTN